jgi:hypothetical protein
MKLKNIDRSASSLGQRYYTMSLAINIFTQTYGRNITQLGSEPRGSAHSNFDLFDFFAELALNCKKVTYSIFHDSELIREQNRERILNSRIYKEYSKASDRIKIKNIKDHNTANINNNIDLLILNDIHFPIEELTARVCPSLDYLSGRNTLNSMSEREIAYGHGDLINPSKERALFEYKLLRSKLNKSSMVVLEGNDYPGGSQTSLVKKQLGSDGFICLLDLQQSVWIRR